MPAPVKNRNATRHGLRAGQLPKGAAYIKRETDVLRRIIENAVADEHDGDVSLYHAALIQSTIRWERHAMLAQRWLRREAESLTLDQRLAFSRDIARASTERDKCLRELGLNTKPNGDPWAILDAGTPAALEGHSANSYNHNGDETHAQDSQGMPSREEGTADDSEDLEARKRDTDHARED